MIAVIDYDAGNIRSVMNALNALNIPAALTDNPQEAEKAPLALLPGVGSFGVASRSLKERGLFDALKRRFSADRPILGICLGLQLMFESSEESPRAEGLGFFQGSVKKLPSDKLKIPHIGWTTLQNCKGCLAPFNGEYFYFVHSYAAECGKETAAAAEYGVPFAAAVHSGCVAACQFHPEKSGALGLKLLKTLIEDLTKETFL